MCLLTTLAMKSDNSRRAFLFLDLGWIDRRVRSLFSTRQWIVCGSNWIDYLAVCAKAPATR
jgi:hypothetical protein